MNKTLSLVTAILFSFDAFSQTWIKPADALDFKGEQVKVVGRITDVRFTTANSRGAARLTVEANQGAPPLTLLIARRKRKHFDISGKDILDEYVHVNGRIIIKKGRPCIRLTSANQIAILYQAPELMRFEPL